MIIINKLEKIPLAYPPEWEGDIEGGGYFYARYVEGILFWGAGDTPEKAVSDCWHNRIEVGYGRLNSGELLYIFKVIDIFVKELVDTIGA